MVTRAPKVDHHVTNHLKSCFPKGDGAELSKIQMVLLQVCGPMTCLWVELIDNDLLSSSEATVNVHNVLNIVQCSLVLLGNANKLVSQLWRSKILQLIDKSLEKYGWEPQCDSGEFLFGSEVTSYLKN